MVLGLGYLLGGRYSYLGKYHMVLVQNTCPQKSHELGALLVRISFEAGVFPIVPPLQQPGISLDLPTYPSMPPVSLRQGSP